MTNASSISEVVSRLVRQGLVARARNSRDGRAVQLSLTAEGRIAAVNGSSPEDDLRHGLEKMAVAERHELSRLLRTLIAGMEDGDSVPQPRPPQLSDRSTSSAAA